MDYTTAIKSRKKVRRSTWKSGYYVELCSNGLLHTSEFYTFDGEVVLPNSGKKPYVRGEHRFHESDFDADDWEFFEEPKVTESFVESGVVLNGQPLYKKLTSGGAA